MIETRVESNLPSVIAAMSAALDSRTLARVTAVGVRTTTSKVAAAVRRAAPKGPTGNLRKGIKARKLRPRSGEISAAGVFARSRTAPHGHLVVLGTTGRRRARGRVLAAPLSRLRGEIKPGRSGFDRKASGTRFLGPSVAPMPANPFVEDAIRASLPAAEGVAIQRMGDRLASIVLGAK